MDNNSNSFNHNLFLNEMSKIKINKAIEIEKYYYTETIKFSLVTGPLYYISLKMQYMNIISFKSNNPITSFSFLNIFKPRNLPNQTINTPFKPVVYAKYVDLLSNIYKQGISTLYKGNAIRLTFFISTNKLKAYFDYKIGKIIVLNKVIKECLLYSMIDILLNPLLFIESRLCIQNNKKGFRISKNIFTLITTNIKELYTGVLYSIPRNVLFVLSLNLYYLHQTQTVNYLTVFLAHLLSYPLLTIHRNLMFRSNNVTYLPHKNYNEKFYKYYFNSFGFFGLFRGFNYYILAVFLWHWFVPRFAKDRYYKNIFKENDKDFFKLNFDEEDNK